MEKIIFENNTSFIYVLIALNSVLGFIFCYYNYYIYHKLIKINYPATELRGILKVVNYFEKPMVSQTLPCKEYPGAELRGIL
ncbi:hypothetical protein COX67_00990 [Candidatus Falkowbacteria bacterium CG_4_10_14_0_2_um_filter_36_22]|nr:MAG: hypothetical protein COZ73_00540 [Candidatus Falkowbacteria bacterium CG_4_8_14_3_um_filter_36_11]PJA11212.1 MAG: hypothetical protein COX67_00990 [Candidatus Falkowbacteria bacterium CG_4_10_14_0_2_um_filter_36_22]